MVGGHLEKEGEGKAEEPTFLAPSLLPPGLALPGSLFCSFCW